MYQLLVAAGGLRSAGLSRSSHSTTATREMGDGQTEGVHIIHDGNCSTGGSHSHQGKSKDWAVASIGL